VIIGFRNINIEVGRKMNNMESGHPYLNVKDVFLNVKNKIYLWILNKFVAKEDEYYGLSEPSTEWMTLHNKKFWIQPCTNCIEEVMK